METFYFAQNEHTGELDRVSEVLALELEKRDVDAEEITTENYYINNMVILRVENDGGCLDILWDVKFENVHGFLLESLSRLRPKIYAYEVSCRNKRAFSLEDQFLKLMDEVMPPAKLITSLINLE